MSISEGDGRKSQQADNIWYLPTVCQHTIIFFFWSKYNSWYIFRNFWENFYYSHLRNNVFGFVFPLLYIKIFNCLLVSFLKRHLASAFCTHVMLSCVLKPMLGAGSPVTSPEALFPHVPSRGLVFGGQRMLVSSPGLRLSAWQGADSSLYSRSQAGSQEPGVRAAKTVTFNVLYSKIYEHVSK